MYFFGLKDGSSINNVLPVADILKSKGHSVLLLADGVARDILDKSERPYCTGKNARNIFAEYPWLQPRLVVVGTCSGGGLSPLPISEVARERGIPVMWIQDYPGNHRKKEFLDNPHIRPDFVSVPDEKAGEYIYSSWPGIPSSAIRVIGSPMFDRFANAYDISVARSELCKKLGIDGTHPILYFPAQGLGTPQALHMVRGALSSVKRPVVLLLRYHPRMLRPDAPQELKDIYVSCKSVENGFGGCVIDATTLISHDAALFGADIVMGMYTLTLWEAVYLRKATVSIFPPEARATHLRETGLASFPLSDLGACFSVENSENLAEILTHIFQNGNTLMPAQERHYQSDGKNAKRISDWILELTA